MEAADKSFAYSIRTYTTDMLTAIAEADLVNIIFVDGTIPCEGTWVSL